MRFTVFVLRPRPAQFAQPLVVERQFITACTRVGSAPVADLNEYRSRKINELEKIQKNRKTTQKLQ